MHYVNNKENNYSEKYELVKIGSFLKRNKTSIEVQDNETYKRVTIRINGGGISVRDTLLGNEIGTKNQFRISKNQFLLSKIDARNGAFGVVPESCDNAIITGNFWTFDVDFNQLNSTYLMLFTSTKHFQHISQTASTGTTNRNYLQENLFLQMQIPLPSLNIQNELVSEYQRKINQAQEAENKAKELEKGIETYLLEALGIEMQTKEEPKPDAKYKYLKMVNSKDISRWDIDFLINGMNEVISNKFESKKIMHICKIGSGGTPSRLRQDYFGGNIPWVKTGEVRETIIFDTEEKITETGLQNSSAKIFPNGSLIIAMYGATAGRTAKLGINASTNQACAVLHEIDNFQVDTNFLWLYLQSQVENFKKISAGSAQPNLNAQKVSNYKIPLPPLSIQNEIVHYISEQKMEIKRLKELAISLRNSAKVDFEVEIFN